jgi:nucleoside-diphosphate-sugar epimerase
MARILITGGAGFIGSHLCERFLDEGHEVICIDNLITGNADNIAHLFPNSRFSFIPQDVTNYIYVKGPLDAILHFASPASPIDYLELPIPTLKVGSLGTHKALGLAKEKGARFLLASTSEVYGDPLEHPQKEDYWGNVNPIGPRGVYDEAKRFAEAMAMAYHRAHKIETRIVRIFNSILADQSVVLFNDDHLHIEPVGEYAERVRLAPDLPRTVLVPAFNPENLRMELRPATALIKYPAHQDAFELRLRYGRSIKVTGDHSVFVRGLDGYPVPQPVREVRVGAHVAIPAYLPVVEHDRLDLNLAQEFTSSAGQVDALWQWAVRHPSLARLVESRREEIHAFLAGSGRYQRTKNFRNTLVCTTRQWIRRGVLPLAVLYQCGLEAPEGAEFGLYGDSNRWLPNRVPVTPDLLWLMGLYLAEGSEVGREGVYFISLCSDLAYLERARAVLEAHFKVRTGVVPPTPGRGPSLYAHSKVLHYVFTHLLGLRERRIPRWVMQLPLSRVKHFLEGFRCGDGTHSGKKLGNELCFDTTSQELAIDLNYLLLRFGIVASFGHYHTTFRKKYGDRRFPFYRLTVCALDNFDILTWDQGVRQTLNAKRIGDLVWSQVIEVTPCLLTGSVYDFSVPGSENFVAGNGVCCHNTYGPRMRLNDGRVVPNFIAQALKGEDLTVYGDGSQTRSFCYVSDLVEGIVRLLRSDYDGPVNLGNPHEMSVLQFARLIIALTGSRSQIAFQPLPVDDPKVRQPDISLARHLLGWEPQVSLEDGLRETITYFKDKLGKG